MNYFFISIFITFAIASQPVPLINHGASCYLNSAIQSLYNVTPLKKLITTSHASFSRPLAQEFSKIIQAIDQKRDYNTLLKNYFKGTVAVQIGCGQQDSAEYIRRVIEGISSSNDPTLNKKIDTLFNFTEIAIITCPNGYTSKTKNSLLELALPIDGDSLDSCINSYLHPEVLDEYRMAKELFERSCIKSLELTIDSPFILISLKRFRYNGTKNNQQVHMPLNLQSDPFKGYALNSAICHQGGTDGGHYWAYVYSDDSWYRCDDTAITQATTDEVFLDIGRKGYLFIYRKTIDTTNETILRKTLRSLLNGLKKLTKALLKKE